MHKRPNSTMKTVGAAIALLGVLSTIIFSCIEMWYRFQNPDLADMRAIINCPEIYVGLAASMAVLIVGSIIFKNN